ncbi:MAG: hypothetical protein JWL63_567 [Rhodocyclales bacterium]|nr:hypothetical protein [Rhodocyclales bacterium]
MVGHRPGEVNLTPVKPMNRLNFNWQGPGHLP